MRARPSSKMTVAEWRQVWLDNPQWRESTRRHNRERTVRFAEVHGKSRIGKIDRRISRVWVDDRPSDHSALSSLFGAAMYETDEHGQPLIATNPFSKIRKRTAARRDLQSGWLTADDIDLLERVAIEVHGPVFGPTMAGMIRFAADTGVRPGELFVLTDASLGDGVVRVTAAADSKTHTVTLPKNGREREAPMSARALAAVRGAMRMEGQELLFATPSGNGRNSACTRPLTKSYWISST